MKIDEVIIKLCAERGYDPSQINDYPTLLEQLECIKSLLETYPNQQYFTLSQYHYNSTTHVYTYNIADINSYGRQINIGDLLIISNESGELDFIQITLLNKETNIGEAEYVGQLTGDKGDKGDKGDTAEVTVQQLHSLIEGSPTVVADINEAGTAINIHLDNVYKTKVDNSLQVPTYTSTATQLVAIGSNKAQTMLGIGSGLAIVSGQLAVTASKAFAVFAINNTGTEYYGDKKVYFMCQAPFSGGSIDTYFRSHVLNAMIPFMNAIDMDEEIVITMAVKYTYGQGFTVKQWSTTNTIMQFSASISDVSFVGNI